MDWPGSQIVRLMRHGPHIYSLFKQNSGQCNLNRKAGMRNFIQLDFQPFNLDSTCVYFKRLQVLYDAK